MPHNALFLVSYLSFLKFLFLKDLFFALFSLFFMNNYSFVIFMMFLHFLIWFELQVNVVNNLTPIMLQRHLQNTGLLTYHKSSSVQMIMVNQLNLMWRKRGFSFWLYTDMQHITNVVLRCKTTFLHHSIRW